MPRIVLPSDLRAFPITKALLERICMCYLKLSLRLKNTPSHCKGPGFSVTWWVLAETPSRVRFWSPLFLVKCKSSDLEGLKLMPSS